MTTKVRRSLTNVVGSNFIQIGVRERLILRGSENINLHAHQLFPELGVRLECIGLLLMAPEVAWVLQVPDSFPNWASPCVHQSLHLFLGTEDLCKASVVSSE